MLKEAAKNSTATTENVEVAPETDETNKTPLDTSIAATEDDVTMTSTPATTTAAHSKSMNDIEEIMESDEDYKPPDTPTTKPKAQAKKRHSLAGDNNKTAGKYLFNGRKINVAGAPKLPHNGYVRFMNDRREQLRREFPKKTSIEYTKIIAEEWQHLPQERKNVYLTAAAEEKQRYIDELNKFLLDRPDVLEKELAKNKPSGKKTGAQAAKNNAQKDKMQHVNNTSDTAVATAAVPLGKDVAKEAAHAPSTAEDVDESKIKSKRTPTPTTNNNNAAAAAGTAATNSNNGANSNNGHSNGNSNSSSAATTNGNGAHLATYTPGEIPIFTNDFLDNNRNLEADCRILRKQRTDLEQQNLILEMHVENTKAGLTKVKREIEEYNEEVQHLQKYLKQIKQNLVASLGSLAIPAFANGADAENIEKYMEELANMCLANTHSPGLNKARDVMRKLEIPTTTTTQAINTTTTAATPTTFQQQQQLQ